MECIYHTWRNWRYRRSYNRA